MGIAARRPGRPPSAAAWAPARRWPGRRLVVEQLQREGVMLEDHPTLEAEPSTRVVEAPDDRVRPRAPDIGPDGERVRRDLHRSVEGEVVAAAVSAGALLADLHEHVVE